MYRSNFLAALVVLAGVLAAQRAEALHRQDIASMQEGARVTGLAAPLSSAVEMPAGQTVSLTQTASLLAGTDAPGRDLITLTQRLRLKSNEPIPDVVNAVSPNYTVGTRHIFNIADITRNNYFTATASIRVVTEHAYWYVKDGYNVGSAALQKAAQHFEEQIYPETRRVFGQEINPGVDNDSRITVLIAQVPGVGGYFSNADAYPRIVNPNSNQRDMIYISSVPRGDPADPDNYFMSTLAHEFQHMIHWNVHRDREVWVDEGCAEIAMYLNGYDPGGSDVSFTLSPDTQLNAWDDTSKAIQHYGASYMFLRYGMDRFGGEDFLGKLLASDRLGAAGFDEALAASGYTRGFDGAFKDWTVANVLNDSKLDGGRYSYSEGGRVAPGRTISGYPATRSESVHQYAADYIRLTGRTRGATITFKGDSTVRVIAAEPHGGSAFWYSNRRELGRRHPHQGVRFEQYEQGHPQVLGVVQYRVDVRLWLRRSLDRRRRDVDPPQRQVHDHEEPQRHQLRARLDGSERGGDDRQRQRHPQVGGRVCRPERLCGQACAREVRVHHRRGV